MDTEQILIFFNVDQNLFHSGTDIRFFEDFLLLFLIDIQNRSHKVRDFAGIVDIDHVEAHFLAEKRIVLTDFLHFADEGARKSLDLKCVEFFVLKILNRSYNRAGCIKSLTDSEPFNRRNKYVQPAVWKIDFAHNSCDSSNGVQVFDCRSFVTVFWIIILEHDKTDKPVGIVSTFNSLGIIAGINHNRRENAREHRMPCHRNNVQLGRQEILNRENLCVLPQIFYGNFPGALGLFFGRLPFFDRSFRLSRLILFNIFRSWQIIKIHINIKIIFHKILKSLLRIIYILTVLVAVFVLNSLIEFRIRII